MTDNLTYKQITAGQWKKLFERINKLENRVFGEKGKMPPCDNCGEKSKFQCGMNMKKELGSWCSNQCMNIAELI